jgi:hypothetical protein
MILTIKDGYDKHEGKDLPMFSRSGKTTISQYQQFTQHRVNSNTPKKKKVEKSEESIDSDFASKNSLDPIVEINRTVSVQN